MKLYKCVELPVLYETEETKRLEGSGLDADSDMYVVKPMTFYQISGIAPERNDSDDTSVITSDGITYSVKMSYSELKAIIDELMI